MGERESRLESFGYDIGEAPKPAGLYSPLIVDGSTVYLSGMVPTESGELKYRGKVPSVISPEEALKAAELCAANLMRVFYRDIGSLDRIDHILKVTGFVNSDTDFTEQHVVMNGASKLFRDVLGEAGQHARAAVGMANLPLGAAVEVDLILRIT